MFIWVSTFDSKILDCILPITTVDSASYPTIVHFMSGKSQY